jgi:hypothetical protein
MTTPNANYHFTKNNYESFVNDVQKLDPKDPDIEQKISEIASRNGVNVGDTVHHSEFDVIPHHHHHHYNDFFEDLIPFRHGFRDIWNMFEKQFEDINVNSDWRSLEAEMPKVEEKDEIPAYGKYVHSYTSYDSDGQRKSRSVSGVEKVINGKIYVSKKMKTEDENGTNVRQVFPDGRVVEQKMPKRKAVMNNQENK